VSPTFWRAPDDEHPWFLPIDFDQPPRDPRAIPQPRPVALFCALCSPPCETCPLRQEEV
jgi:hypothetical protein